MKTKVIKIIMLSIGILLVFSSTVKGVTSNTFAIDTNMKVADIGKIEPGDWKPAEESASDSEATKTIGKILGIIRNMGVTTSVISLMLIGFKTLYGSIEEKSYYKELLPGFLIGAFLFLAATTIPSVIFNFFYE